MDREKSKKRLAATGLVASVTAAGVFLSGLFGSAGEILTPEDESRGNACTDRYDIDGADGGAVDDADADGEDEDAEKKRPGLRAAARRRLLSLPLSVRALVVLPLWAVGTGLTALCSALFTALSPAAERLFTWLLIAGVIFGVFLLGAKTLFPDLPLKKLLNRKTVPFLLISAALLCLLDAALTLFWTDYDDVRGFLRALGVALTTGTALLALGVRRRRAAAAKEADRPGEEPGEEPGEKGDPYTLIYADGKLTYSDRR